MAFVPTIKEMSKEKINYKYYFSFYLKIFF